MSRAKRKGPNRAVSPATELLFNFGQATGGRDWQRHWGSLRNPKPPSVFHFPACCLDTFTLFFYYSLFHWFWLQIFHSKDCALPPPAAAPARRSQRCLKPEGANHCNSLRPEELWGPVWCLRRACPHGTQGAVEVHQDLSKNLLSSLADLDEPAVKQSPTWWPVYSTCSACI